MLLPGVAALRAPRLAAAGAKVTVVTREPLRRLMQTLQGVEAVILFGDPLPPADCHLGFMSLPAALGTTLETIPAEVPYLAAPADARAAWRDVSRPGARRRVGIAWRGNAGHRNDRHRSLPLELFLDGLPKGPDYVCLLHDVTSEEADLLARRDDVEVHSGRIRDLADTAAICATLDLVVSVDTSIAHLAGALALPVFVLLPHNPDWRWMLDRQDSPWYPTARMFRRPVGQGWAPTLAAVQDAVVATVSGGRAR